MLTNMKNKLFLFLIILSFFTMKSSAQSMGSSYETAVGIKFWPAAVSVKHFFSDDVAVEGLPVDVAQARDRPRFPVHAVPSMLRAHSRKPWPG